MLLKSLTNSLRKTFRKLRKVLYFNFFLNKKGGVTIHSFFKKKLKILYGVPKNYAT
jgi:hypothetical protein